MYYCPTRVLSGSPASPRPPGTARPLTPAPKLYSLNYSQLLCLLCFLSEVKRALEGAVKASLC